MSDCRHPASELKTTALPNVFACRVCGWWVIYPTDEHKARITAHMGPTWKAADLVIQLSPDWPIQGVTP